jgi:hypothetical protein
MIQCHSYTNTGHLLHKFYVSWQLPFPNHGSFNSEMSTNIHSYILGILNHFCDTTLVSDIRSYHISRQGQALPTKNAVSGGSKKEDFSCSTVDEHGHKDIAP